MTSIISWNVNGIRAAQKKGFLEWLYIESPDILCLQETKARKEQLTSELINPVWKEGVYKTYWQAASPAIREPLSSAKRNRSISAR